MRKRTSPTMMELATEAVPAFKIVLSLIYSAGLRGQEVINLKISDARFIAKDYRDRGRQKPVSLTGAEFLGRFCQHAGIAENLPLSADSIPAAGS